MAIEPSHEHHQSQTFIPEDMLIEYEALARSAVIVAAMDDDLRSSDRHAVRSQRWRDVLRPTAVQNTVGAILVAVVAPTIWLTLGSASSAWALVAGVICVAACLNLIVAAATTIGQNRQKVKDTLRMLLTDEEQTNRQARP